MDWDDREYRQEPDCEVTLNTEVSVQWNNDAVIQQVIGKVADRVYKDIKPQVQKAVLTSLDAQVNQAITAVLDTEIQPTDKWGEATGDKISIRALLQRDAEAWLVENVDYQGHKGSDAYGQKHPRVHWIIQEALNGPKDHRGRTRLRQMVIDAAKNTIGDVTHAVEDEIRKQVHKTWQQAAKQS